jgi:2-oxoglutarate dehydrogenase E2 component (dihydrolipoamide succinyltransferase)
MAVNITVPELGESVIEATVSHWHKKPGDPVAAGEAVVELETEKVNLEVGAAKAGVLGRIDKPEGQDVRIGEVLGVIEEGAVAGAPAQPATPGQTAEARQTTPEAAQPEPQQKARPAAAPPAEQPKNATTQPEAPAAPPSNGDGDRATPVARRLADEQGVDLTQVSASGPGGRVTKHDVETYLQQRPTEPPTPPTPPRTPVTTPPAPALPAPAPDTAITNYPLPMASATRREERARMSRRRRTIARRLVEAQQTAAMLTTFNEINMGAVMDIRKRRKEWFKEKHGVGLGFMSFFVKASVGALKAFPMVNAEIQGDEIVYKHYYDIGMAIGSEEGLVVPVLRDADRMSFAEIEKAIEGFVEKSRNDTLSLEDLRGGTFTVTNGGVFGSLLSTPILNPPQVAILGLHKIEDRPVARQGQVVIRPMMYVALSYDHRLVDGREAVQFLVRVKELIEDPETMLIEG